MHYDLSSQVLKKVQIQEWTSLTADSWDNSPILNSLKWQISNASTTITNCSKFTL
uniref:Uncharacterized protein n=1 Tax=Tetranychus urticae TaxID=32264 RepID=T1KJ88_TETUR